MLNLLDNLLVNLIWAVIALGAAFIGNLLYNILPARRLWGFRDPDDLVICAASLSRTDTGEYLRPHTGMGELRALVYIINSLSRAYRRIHVRNVNVVLADDQLKNRIENDIIVLGGPKNNPVTRKLLDKLLPLQIADQHGSIIQFTDNDGILKEYVPESEGKQVKTDYGLIIRVDNPFSSDKNTVFLFSGGHTYGVIAAAKFYTDHYYKGLKWRSRPKQFAALVQCDVHDDFPVAIRLIAEVPMNPQEQISITTQTRSAMRG